MKIIFLDVDGVLNSQDFFRRQIEEEKKKHIYIEDQLDDENIKNLKKIVESTNAKIVVTSAWKIIKRDMVILSKKLKEYNLEIYSKTKNYGDLRALEILEWLKENENVENYVVIDDEFFKDYYLIKDKLVLTDQKYGLSNNDVNKAIKILIGE